VLGNKKDTIAIPTTPNCVFSDRKQEHDSIEQPGIYPGLGGRVYTGVPQPEWLYGVPREDKLKARSSLSIRGNQVHFPPLK